MIVRRSGTIGTQPKARTGIRGLDALTLGGIPAGRVTLIEGGPGVGKTVLGLQSLAFAARHLREAGIFVAFEERSADVLANASSFAWDLPKLRPTQLFFLDAQPSVDLVQSGNFDLGGLLVALQAKAKQIGARRVVFDGIDQVLTSLTDATAERQEMYRLRDWASAHALTTIITSKASKSAPTQERAESLQFMADCAVRLEHSVVEGVSQRTLRVLKFRGSAFQENSAPYLIGASGFDVAGTEEPAARSSATLQRISSGIERLDAMLGGGFFRSAAILVTGSPGTAKTTLGGAFAEAACARGEPTLYISFDSEASEVIRNLASVGIRLGRYIGKRKPGLLRLNYQLALFGSAETHLLEIQSLARRHGAKNLIIDPLSALANVNDLGRVNSVARRLLGWAKTQNITLFCTSLLDVNAIESEGTPLHISTIADTWIHLSYVARSGERNRCLSIVKSRGTAHSNQVRELILGDGGVTLSDAYGAGGEVLLGTMRWERERAEEARRREAEQAERMNQIKLITEQAELNAQIAALRSQHEAKRAQLKLAEHAASLRRRDVIAARKEALSRRGADTAKKNRRS